MAKKLKKKSDKVEDVLNILQTFGKYQIIQYFYICLPIIFISMGNVSYVFVAGDIDYRCRVPECESEDSRFCPSWWPVYNDQMTMNVNRCDKPTLNYTYLDGNKCDNKSFTSSVSECTEWVYGSNKTIVAWLNLACKRWETNFVGSVHSMGAVIGMLLGGWATDRFGRKPTHIVTSVGIISGNLKTFIQSYYLYLSVEFIESIMSGAAFAAGMVLIMEISGNDQRILAGVVHAYAIYSGEALLAGIAMILSYWKWIVYIICTPPILFLFYINLEQESPRWLVLHNKYEVLKRILKLISKLNNLNIDPKDVDRLDEENLKKICNVEMNPQYEGFKEAFKSFEIVKRIIIATVARFSVSFIYYGLVANSVWLPGNKYTNYILMALISFPGDILALYFMNKWGRRLPLFYGYLICGISCGISSLVPDVYLWMKIILYMIGKLMTAACFTGIWTYTMEIFPTSIRGSMYGLCAFTSSAGCILAPLTPAMDAISPIFSSIFFGCAAVASSFLILLGPETKGQPLPATIENIKINSPVFMNNSNKDSGNRCLEYDDNICVHL